MYNFTLHVVLTIKISLLLNIFINNIISLFRRKRSGNGEAAYRQTAYAPYGPDSNYNSSALLSGKWPGTPSSAPRTGGYAHIWELKNPPIGGGGNTVDAHGVTYIHDVMPSNGGEAQDNISNSSRPVSQKTNREHIYESPKFQRKEFGEVPIGGVAEFPPGMVPYYHEFDLDHPERHHGREISHIGDCGGQHPCMDS